MPALRAAREIRSLTKPYRKFLRTMRTKRADFPEMSHPGVIFGFCDYRIFIGCPPHCQPTMAQSHFGAWLECGGS